ncbi:hypothetical protein OROHE_001323 [Orobanche hederae]
MVATKGGERRLGGDRLRDGVATRIEFQAEGSGISTELRERIWWPEAGTIPPEFGLNPRDAENNMKFRYLKSRQRLLDLSFLE